MQNPENTASNKYENIEQQETTKEIESTKKNLSSLRASVTTSSKIEEIKKEVLQHLVTEETKQEVPNTPPKKNELIRKWTTSISNKAIMDTMTMDAKHADELIAKTTNEIQKRWGSSFEKFTT